jgi:hypothetical protein
MGKDVLYDTMNREDLNWRKLHEQVAYKAIQALKPSGCDLNLKHTSKIEKYNSKLKHINLISACSYTF